MVANAKHISVVQGTEDSVLRMWNVKHGTKYLKKKSAYVSSKHEIAIIPVCLSHLSQSLLTAVL